MGFDPDFGEVFKLGKKVDNLPKSLATMIGSGAGDTSGGVGGTEKAREDEAEKKKQTTLFGTMAPLFTILFEWFIIKKFLHRNVFIGLFDATQVIDVAITSSPGPTPKASSAECNVDVPELQPIAYF